MRLQIWILLLSAALLSGAAHAAAPFLPAGAKAEGAIEVTADALEVLQKQNKAVFTGHVVVTQGEVRLTAEKMTVHYAAPEEKKDAKPAGKTPKGKKESGAQDAIKRIDAQGSVFLSTGTETASGAGGSYDIARQEIQLRDKVVLTRGKNVLKGDKLVYNFISGRSVLSAAGETLTPGTPGKARVRALFVPEDKKGQ